LSRYFKAEIKENRPLNAGHKLLSLINLEQMNEPLPGQFYMLGIGEKGFDPLLKRAFCFFKRTEEGFQILYRIKGRGTSILAGMKQGAVIELLGPLGNSYPVPASRHIPIIIAGGIGIASVFPLIEKLSKRSYVFYGARTKDELLMLEELKGVSRLLELCTDDGSLGEKGTVTDSLKKFLAPDSSLLTTHIIYACGPAPMLKAVSDIAADQKIKGYVSLEENMACGVGACVGCVVKTTKGYKRVCKEGPVFPIEEIVW
jgi:dihydroorotate dehydrogenase electron transfer subunit